MVETTWYNWLLAEKFLQELYLAKYLLFYANVEKDTSYNTSIVLLFQ